MSEVDLLMDYTVTHPGARSSTFSAAQRSNMSNKETIGDMSVKDKIDKYNTSVVNLSPHTLRPLVLFPLPVSSYGRMHPITLLLLEYLIKKAASLRSTCVEALHSRGDNWDVDNITSYERIQWRSLSTIIQRRLVEGLYESVSIIAYSNVCIPTTVNTSLPLPGALPGVGNQSGISDTA